MLSRLRQSRLSRGVIFSTWPLFSFVRPFVYYQTCQHDILKTNEAILLQIGTSGSRSKGMKMSTTGVRRSKIKAQEAEVRLGCRAETSFSASLSSFSTLVRFSRKKHCNENNRKITNVIRQYRIYVRINIAYFLLTYLISNAAAKPLNTYYTSLEADKWRS